MVLLDKSKDFVTAAPVRPIFVAIPSKYHEKILDLTIREAQLMRIMKSCKETNAKTLRYLAH